MANAKDIYPLSTKDSKAIPLDIIRPRNLIIKSFSSSANEVFTIQDTASVAILIASADCIVFLGTPHSSIEDGTNMADTLFVPKNTAVATTVKQGSTTVRGLSSSGILTVQTIEQWAGLGLEINYTRR